MSILINCLPLKMYSVIFKFGIFVMMLDFIPSEKWTY
jgi:hypothetical protein